MKIRRRVLPLALATAVLAAAGGCATSDSPRDILRDAATALEGYGRDLAAADSPAGVEKATLAFVAAMKGMKGRLENMHKAYPEIREKGLPDDAKEALKRAAEADRVFIETWEKQAARFSPEQMAVIGKKISEDVDCRTLSAFVTEMMQREYPSR